MWTADWSERAAQQTIFRDGLIDVWFRCPWQGTESLLYVGWVVALAANVLLRVDSFRYAVQAPACEYGVQIEFLSTNGYADCSVQLAVGGSLGSKLALPFGTPAVLGPYSVGDRDKAMNLIIRDLYEASGQPTDFPLPTLEIGWSALEAGR